MLPEPIALFEHKYRNSDTPLADYEVAKSYGGYYDGMFPPVVFTKFPFQPTNETLQEGYAMLVEARERNRLFLDKIPQELKSIDSWLNWRFEIKLEGASDSVYLVLNKTPYRSHGWGRASVNRPETWGTFEQARIAYETGKYDGVGLVQSHTVGVDLDNKNGPFDPQMLTNLRLNTYAERSPSGGGIRQIGYGELPAGANRKGTLELYDKKSARYLTITGDHIEGTPISINTCDFTELHSRMVAGEFGENRGGGAQRSGNDDSLSIADWKLVGDVVAIVGRDPDDIEQEMREGSFSEHYRSKWDEYRPKGGTYLRGTIENWLDRHQR